MDLWKNKVALVTGASSGIGAALAQQLVEHGGSVVLVARREDRLLALAESLGPTALAIVGDVTDPVTSQRAVEAAVRRFGTLDVVIANAGISMNGRFVDTEPEVFERMMAVNYFGAVNLLRSALPVLEVSSGSFTFVSSVAGKRGLPTRSGYAASKFALHGLFESVRCELADSGVHLGMVCPGYTATAIRVVALGPDGQSRNEGEFTSGRVMPREVAAEKILAAIAARRREVVLTGGGRLIVTLNKLAPALLDRLACWIVK
jgi:NAD(P)-dependent dehydrogenase (short-subunit alcohol dehydrogenase family)